MFCDKCGASCPDNTTFCTNCGQPLTPAASSYNPNPQPYNQQSYNPQPSSQQAYNAKPAVSGTPALVWGILGLSFACTFYLSFLGIIFSAIGKGKANSFRAATGNLTGPAKVGSILATIGLILGIVLTVIFLIVVVFIGASL